MRTIGSLGLFDFPNISVEQIKSELLEGMAHEDAEVARIAGNPESPSFENTIAALEKSGEELEAASTLMYNLHSAETNDELDALADEMAPLLSEHSARISQNEVLFLRIKAVWEAMQNGQMELGQEESRLTEDIYQSFVRSGAALQGEARERYRDIVSQLSQLSLQFSNNLRRATNAFQLHITNEAELAGLPDGIMEQAAASAKEKELEGWIFTLKAPSYVPFMTYADNRALREKLYTAYSTRCTKDAETSNFGIVREIVTLRLELANLLGYATYADYVLPRRMAGSKEKVAEFLQNLIDKFRRPAELEVADIAAFAKQQEGKDFELMPWDFSYYAHKLRLQRFNIDAEMLRPYFELSKVIKGVFSLAERLYGIGFQEMPDAPLYHKEVMVYAVKDTDGSHLATLYVDFHPREGKQGGAWMTNWKEQFVDEEGKDHRPQVSLVMNFTRSTPTRPSLLTLDEVETFLHEFGHALHSIFSKVKHKSLSGTNVRWDFVELPSQFMENYATQKEFLQPFDRHYQSGELLPDDLIQRVGDSRNFNVAYACMRQVSFGSLDMVFHTITIPFTDDILAFEQKAWQAAQLLPTLPEACMVTGFSHIMAGGYAAGYYSYKWAEVLDADAFAYFKEKGIFSREVAASWRENVLSKGNTADPMALYMQFRGQAPSIDALLERCGLSQAELEGKR